MERSPAGNAGFTLLELLVATAIFMVICGAMFGLLQVSQQKYAIESQMSGSFQEARLGLDQIVRDINISGYPSPTLFSNTSNPLNYALAPFAWDPGYQSNLDCQIGVNCLPTPSDHDLLVETTVNGVVSWIRYQLIGTKLYRGVVPKTTGDPVSAFTLDQMTPLVNNVMNYPSAAQLAQITTEYPSMLPTGSQSIFVYSCTNPNTPGVSQPCSLAGAYNAPRYISDVDVTLIVQTAQQDLQTQSLKMIELTGRGHRTNSGN
jgi:prepilin-type N-terminal cleavage/methylation domain-containing protein